MQVLLSSLSSPLSRSIQETHTVKSFFAFSAVPLLIFITGFWLWPNKNYADYVPPPEEQPLRGQKKLEEPDYVASAVKLPDGEYDYFEQTCSWVFISGAIFTMFNLLRVNFYIGTVEYQVESIVGNPKYWTEVFGFVLPIGGLISAPIVGWLLDHKPVWFNVCFLQLVGLAYGALICMNTVTAMVAAFAVFAFFRAYLFSCMAHFVTVAFGMSNFGKLWGTIFTLSGILNFGIVPMTMIVHTYLNGEYAWVNLVCLMICGALSVFPLSLAWNRKQALWLPSSFDSMKKQDVEEI